MLGRERIIELLEDLTKEGKAHGAGQAEALYVGSHNSVTRFANSAIIQNVRESDRKVYVRVLSDKRLGISSTNSLRREDLRGCLKKAISIARQTRPLKFLDSFPGSCKYPEIKTYFPETADFTISDKINILDDLFRKTGPGIRGGGACSTAETEICIVNSNGVRAYQPFTSAHMTLITSSPSASGYASRFDRNIENMDTDNLVSTAMKKVLVKGRRKRVKPGRYTVLLEPAAVNEILEWLVYTGFGAGPFIDGTSFMSGNIGKKIMDDAMTIYDDGNDLSGFPVPFDFEGIGKRRMDIIKNGVAKAVAYDTLLAKKRRRKATGHALIPEDMEGPFPSNVFIRRGKRTIEEMASMVERGILVTRFHYVNGLLDTRSASMTGMTRDGTFYIEDGKIKYPVEDMRFTESILNAFSRIEATSMEREAFPVPWSDVGACVVPALLIRDFNFSD